MLRRLLRVKLTAAAVAVLTMLSAGFIAAAPPASAATFVTISGAGSTWVQPAINLWQADVQQSGLTVNYSGVGSTSGRAQFSQGVVNFAASEIPYGVPDMNGVTDSPPTRGFAYMPDVAGGLTLMYNLVIGGQRVTNLRLGDKTVADIFTGAILYWDDPEIEADNPDLALPHIGITPVVRADGSGTTADFTQWMLATDPAAWQRYCGLVGASNCIQTSAYPVWSGDPAMHAAVGDAGVSGIVSQNDADGAIGYVDYSSALASGFPVAKLLNAAGYYTEPTPGNVGVSLLDAQFNTDGTANLSQVYTDPDPRTYELSAYSYLVIPTDTSVAFPLTADQGFSLGAFGSFLLCQGQQQVDPLGYSALPINLVENGYAQLQKIPGAQVPATISAFIQGCNNPTFSTDGTNTLATTDPMPPACDQQGAVQCSATGGAAQATTTTVTVSPNPAEAGQTTTLTATVTSPSGATPAGSVQFSIAGTLIGTMLTLNSSGAASVTETFTTAGTQLVSAAFFTADSSSFENSIGSASVTVVPSSEVLTQTITTTVPPSGTFTLTAPTASTVTLTSNGTVTAGNGTEFGTMNSITITDSRNTYPGWSVLGQATDFTNPTSNPPGDIPASYLGWAPEGVLADGAVLGPAVTPNAPGIGPTGAVLASASAGNGFGTSTLSAFLMLSIPPLVPSGAYSGVLTLTADPASP